MKHYLQSTVISILCLVLVSFSVAAQSDHHGSGGGGGESCLLTADQIPFQTLDSQVSETLLFMYEEEKLAHDVYLALFSLYGSPVFNNISGSEQQHMDTLKAFVDAWQLNDPVLPEAGKFSNPDLQTMYDELVEKGSVSALDAFKIGAFIEELDIQDLQNAIQETENPELKNAYQNLQAASFNHLRAFSKQIINLEGSYTAQLLSDEMVESILSMDSTTVFQGNALLYNGLEISPTSACFISVLEDSQGTLQNGANINQSTPISLMHTIKPLTQDINQPADWVIVAFYSDANGQTTAFARQGDVWQVWDGDMNHLPAAGQTDSLALSNTLSIFEGTLSGLNGQLQIHSGYRLDEGSVVFNRFPLIVNLD